MVKDNNNYLYLIVPNEYRCVYYNILDTLGTLGEDLLSSCTATCKGRAISGFACYNMFMAACAAYYLGQVKKARVLISYIKAQLEINCDKILIFEDSLSDEWIFLTVPKVYQCTFEKLLNKLATWGQELLDDCTVSCKGSNKNILNAWNLFNAACIAYDTCGVCKADYIVNYIKGLLGFNCPGEEPGYDTPVIKNFALTYRYDSYGPTIDILSGTVQYDNEQNLVENSLKLVNANTNEVIVDNLPISGSLTFNIYDYAVTYGTNIKFVLKAVDINGSTISSNEFTISIPNIYVQNPNIKIDRVIFDNTGTQIELREIVIKCDYPNSFNSDGWTLSVKNGNQEEEIIRTNITPGNVTTTNFDNTKVYEIPNNGIDLIIKVSGVSKDNVVCSDTYRINAQRVEPLINPPVITITNVDYDFSLNMCNIHSVEAHIDNPENISGQGLTLKVGFETIRENILSEETILIDDIVYSVEAGLYMTTVTLEGIGLDGETYRDTYPINLNPNTNPITPLTP